MKNRMKMGWVVLMISAVAFFMAATGYAGTISNNRVIIKSGDVSVNYDFDEVKTEVENGKTKVCICRCLCFRALQMLTSRFADGVIPRDDIKIVTGWTTDGPEELFVEVMGWPHSDVLSMENATKPALLTLEDAVFFFVQKSTGRAWKVMAREGLYPKAFFSYRTSVKTKSATEEEIAFFQNALRPQAVANMALLPMIDRFDVQMIAIYGEDEVLRIPACFVSGGGEYEVELKTLGNNLFELIKVEAN